MKVGDLVAAKYDIEREIGCAGVVVKVRMPRRHDTIPGEALVAWASENGPMGWHYVETLEVINESR